MLTVSEYFLNQHITEQLNDIGSDWIHRLAKLGAAYCFENMDRDLSVEKMFLELYHHCNKTTQAYSDQYKEKWNLSFKKTDTELLFQFQYNCSKEYELSISTFTEELDVFNHTVIDTPLDITMKNLSETVMTRLRRLSISDFTNDTYAAKSLDLQLTALMGSVGKVKPVQKDEHPFSPIIPIIDKYNACKLYLYEFCATMQNISPSVNIVFNEKHQIEFTKGNMTRIFIENGVYFDNENALGEPVETVAIPEQKPNIEIVDPRIEHDEEILPMLYFSGNVSVHFGNSYMINDDNMVATIVGISLTPNNPTYTTKLNKLQIFQLLSAKTLELDISGHHIFLENVTIA